MNIRILMVFCIISVCALSGSAEQNNTIKLISGKSVTAAGKGIKGELPSGWQIACEGANANVNCKVLQEDAISFFELETNRIDNGFVELEYPINLQDSDAQITLTWQLDTLNGVTVGIRTLTKPYKYIWSFSPDISQGWRTENHIVQIPKLGQKLAMFISINKKSILRLSEFNLGVPKKKILKKVMKGENLVRISRFPLGLPCGWCLPREISDDDVEIVTDPNLHGPSKSPALHVHFPQKTKLIAAPFEIPSGVNYLTASIYIRGKGFGRMYAFSGINYGRKEELGETLFSSNDQSEWKRVILTFKPVPNRLFQLVAFEMTGDLWLDGLQIEPGRTASEYTSQFPYEVALSCPESDASSVRIQFDDEPAKIVYSVTGNDTGGVLKSKITNIYGESKLLPDIKIDKRFQTNGTLEYDIFRRIHYGPFRVEAWVENPSGKQISSVNEIVVNRIRRPRYWLEDAPNSSFGLHIPSIKRHCILAKAIGVNWVRFLDACQDCVGWAFIEPQKGYWCFKDRDIQRIRNNHLKILAMLGTTPKWASYYQKVYADNTGYMDRWYLPLNMVDFENYVKTVATRYKGVIDAYEIWNEPFTDYRMAVGYDRSAQRSIPPKNPAMMYTRLTRAARGVLRKVDPAIKIIGLNSVCNEKGKRWTPDVLAAGGVDECDILGYHDYCADTPGFPGDQAEVAYNNAIKIVKNTKEHATKPVWMTEGTCVAGKIKNGLYLHTLAGAGKDEKILTAANDMIRHYVRMFSLGVNKIFLYSVHNYINFGSDDSYYLALVTQDGFPHPLATVHAYLAWMLENTKFNRIVTLQKNVYAFIFAGAKRSIAVLAVKPGDETYRLPYYKNAEWSDMFGNILPAGSIINGTSVAYLEMNVSAEKLAQMLMYPQEKTASEIEFRQPQNYGVYQRSDDNTAEIPVEICNCHKKIANVSWRLSLKDNWKKLAFKQDAEIVKSSIKLPSGGWYKLEIQMKDENGKTTTHTIDHVGVGEVFLTVGQSNSANWGEPKQKTTTGRVTVFDGNSWRPAIDPLPVCDGEGGSIWPLVGDRLSIKLNMPVGFLCLGVGGSSISEWRPEKDQNKAGKQPSYYQRFTHYVPLLAPYGCRAVLWHQGETNRGSRQEDYYNDLKSIIDGFNRDFGAVPWMVAIVGNRWVDPKFGIGCCAAQRQIITEGLAHMGPDTDTLGKEFRLKDGKSSHFNQQGLEKHAALWCEAISREFYHDRH